MVRTRIKVWKRADDKRTWPSLIKDGKAMRQSTLNSLKFINGTSSLLSPLM